MERELKKYTTEYLLDEIMERVRLGEEGEEYSSAIVCGTGSYLQVINYTEQNAELTNYTVPISEFRHCYNAEGDDDKDLDFSQDCQVVMHLIIGSENFVEVLELDEKGGKSVKGLILNTPK